ncbi:glycosyltransferase family 61 protein [Methylobacterium sp. CM6244]
MSDLEHPERSSAQIRKIIGLCRDDTQSDRWQPVIDRTSDLDICVAHPKLLLLRLQAAVRLERTDLCEEIASRIIDSKLPNVIKFAAVRILGIGHFPDTAARILALDGAIRKDNLFLRLAALYSKGVEDRDLKRGVRSAMRVASRGGSVIKPLASEYGFDPPSVRDTWGTVRISPSPGSALHHPAGLRREISSFKRATERAIPSTILEYRDVFTSPRGQIWNQKGQIIYSRSDSVDVTDRKTVKTLPLAFAANRMSRGLYHWLIDHLPRFAWIVPSGILSNKQFSILLNGHRPFESETLDLLGLRHVAVGLTETVFVERLLVPPPVLPLDAGDLHLPAVFEPLGERADAIAREQGAHLPERVYITRRDATRRPLVNESEIEREVAAHDFTVLEFSALPLWHQIAIARNARIIMGPHGAGLSHIVFAKPGTKVIELMPIRDGTYKQRFNFVRLSLLRGHNHVVWLENQPTGLDRWSIAVPQFRKFLLRALRGPE